MPQAPNWLRRKFPGGDSEALGVIATNFDEQSGLITPKAKDYKATQHEHYAILYLIEEWDYAYISEPRTKKEVPGAK